MSEVATGDHPDTLEELAAGPPDYSDRAIGKFRYVRDAIEQRGAVIVQGASKHSETHIARDDRGGFRVASRNVGGWRRYAVGSFKTWLQLRVVLADDLEAVAIEATELHGLDDLPRLGQRA